LCVLGWCFGWGFVFLFVSPFLSVRLLASPRIQSGPRHRFDDYFSLLFVAEIVARLLRRAPLFVSRFSLSHSLFLIFGT